METNLDFNPVQPHIWLTVIERSQGPDMSFSECYITQPGWSKWVCVVDTECKQVVSRCYMPRGPPCAAGVYMVVIWLIL